MDRVNEWYGTWGNNTGHNGCLNGQGEWMVWNMGKQHGTQRVTKWTGWMNGMEHGETKRDVMQRNANGGNARATNI